ncbi:MAG: hypothetical protein HY740_00960 [Chloroflexi bacterium]|nr:hypothetical protein [Chloroflexota bacterium]
MAKDLSLILAESLEALDRGVALENVLAHYPEQRAELEELLTAARTIQAAPTVAASPLFKKSARARLLRKLSSRESKRFSLIDLFRPLQRQGALSFALALALIVVITSGTVLAANNSLPGDSLYGVKRGVEQMRAAVSPNDPALHIEFANERLNEARALIKLGKLEGASQSLKDYENELKLARAQITTPQPTLEKQIEQQQTILQTVAPQIPTPTKTQEPTPLAATASPTATKSEDKNSESSKTPEANKTVEPSKTPEPSKTVESSKTPEPSKTIEPSKTPEPSKTIEPSRTPQPSQTPKPSETKEPTETKKPDNTPKPTKKKKP